MPISLQWENIILNNSYNNYTVENITTHSFKPYTLKTSCHLLKNESSFANIEYQ